MINSILNSFWHQEDGQDMVEYALLLAFISLVKQSSRDLASGKPRKIRSILFRISHSSVRYNGFNV